MYMYHEQFNKASMYDAKSHYSAKSENLSNGLSESLYTLKIYPLYGYNIEHFEEYLFGQQKTFVSEWHNCNHHHEVSFPGLGYSQISRFLWPHTAAHSHQYRLLQEARHLLQ